MDNPPAFPNSGAYGHSGDYLPEGGMTLRDWFAGLAINAIYSRPLPADGDEGPMDVNARDAYRIADAMLAARTNGGQSNG